MLTTLAGSRRRRSRRMEGRHGQMTPTSSSMPDQRQTWTMSSGFLVSRGWVAEGGGYGRTHWLGSPSG
jgi:hypothetical protein